MSQNLLEEQTEALFMHGFPPKSNYSLSRNSSLLKMYRLLKSITWKSVVQLILSISTCMNVDRFITKEN